MSLARAFTVRRNKATSNGSETKSSFIGRAASQRSPNSKPIIRSQISLPVELISTTNMLSYEAPDIVGAHRMVRNRAPPSSSASSISDASEDSDRSSTSAHSNETAATSVDGSAPSSPDSNHLSCYFKPSVDTSDRNSQSTAASPRISFDSPVIPQRAPSHSKKAHVLSHKRSVQRMVSVHERDTSRTSLDMFKVSEDVESISHPFGKELQQLSEVAEEYVQSAMIDIEAEEDRAALQSRNLGHFCATDYMNEISSFYTTAFEEDAAKYQPMCWI